MMYYNDYGYGFGAFGLVWHVISIIIVIAIVAFVIRMFVWGPRRRHFRNRMLWHSDALTILEERYAKGEISKEEFEERRKTLMGDSMK